VPRRGITWDNVKLLIAGIGAPYHRADVVQQRLDRCAGCTRRRWLGEFVAQFDSVPLLYSQRRVEDRVTALRASEGHQLLAIDSGFCQLALIVGWPYGAPTVPLPPGKARICQKTSRN
jgi:hypothetical protein